MRIGKGLQGGVARVAMVAGILLAGCNGGVEPPSPGPIIDIQIDNKKVRYVVHGVERSKISTKPNMIHADFANKVDPKLPNNFMRLIRCDKASCPDGRMWQEDGLTIKFKGGRQVVIARGQGDQLTWTCYDQNAVASPLTPDPTEDPDVAPDCILGEIDPEADGTSRFSDGTNSGNWFHIEQEEFP